MRIGRQTLAVVLGVGVLVCLGVLWFWSRPSRPSMVGRELLRSELTLREGRLYAAGEKEPFTGKLVEDFSPQRRKLEIEIKNGKADGHSLGWYENGQLEVDECFTGGISNGLRTRWHENGQKKSSALIVNGELEGLYVEWHDNGHKAVEMTIREGNPDGVAWAWHPNGKLKSESVFAEGIIVRQEFWPPEGEADVAVAR